MDMERSSKGARDMQLADEMHDGIVRLAGERGWHETREAWLARAARKAGLSFRRAKSFFYREPATAYRASDVEAVRAAIAKHKTGADHARRQKAALESPEEIDARIAVLARELTRISAELDDIRARRGRR